MSTEGTHWWSANIGSCKTGFILFDFINARTRAYAPHWAMRRANIAPRRCVVNYKYEHTCVYACKLPWRLYPLVERDPRKRIWLDEISTPALKVQLGVRTRVYARRTVRWEYERFNVCACICAYTRARSMNPALWLGDVRHQAITWTNVDQVLLIHSTLCHQGLRG